MTTIPVKRENATVAEEKNRRLAFIKVKKEVIGKLSDYTKPDPNTVDTNKAANAKRVKDFSAVRREVLNNWMNNKGFASKNMQALEASFQNFVGEKRAFGTDAISMKNRQELKDMSGGDVVELGGNGKFRPYTIINGIVRGGLIARGKNVNVGGVASYAIPITPANDTRKLESLRARYTDPTKVPSTREIKFIRGRWGGASGKTTAENLIW